MPAQTVHGNTHDPRMPHQWASPILAVLGLTDYSSNVTHVVKRSTAAKQSTPNAVDPTDCTAITGIAGDCNLPQDFAKRYGLSGLYAKGARGAGTTLGIVTLAGARPGRPGVLLAQHRPPQAPATARVTVKNIDGGPGAPSDASGSDETDLDVEQSGGAAPDANVDRVPGAEHRPRLRRRVLRGGERRRRRQRLHQLGRVGDGDPCGGRRAARRPRPTQAVFDEAFLEFGAQKQSAFASSGDAAAYDDNDELGTTELVVDTPADSPYISAAGGTTLPCR